MVWHKAALSNFRRRRHEQQFRRSLIFSAPDANRRIRQLILDSKPLMVSRFGGCEINVLNIYRQRQRNLLSKYYNYLITGVPPDYTEKVRYASHNNAGVFPSTDEGLDRFAQITFDACRHIDVLGVWHFLRLEAQLYQEKCPSALLVDPQSVEPYFHPQPWSSALRGKRVLVIHPFEESIQRQYLKRELLFPATEILPEFELKTIRAVQSAAGQPVDFRSWANALEHMKSQINQVEFDIALIGAGAYGLPLAAHVKNMGRQAVHMGGALQILFGIRGGRWDDNPGINRFYNEHWARPLPSETPQTFKNVEGGCYW